MTTATGESREDKLLNRLAGLTDNWKCPQCGSPEKKRIMLFLVNDDVIEHIVCGACGVEDHNATMCLEVTFDKEEVT